MKKILVLCLALFVCVGVAMAQKPASKGQKTVKTTVFVTNLDCPSCAKKVENNIPVLGKGIKDYSIDLSKREVTVVYDATKNSDEQIIEGFRKLKVEASVKGEPAKK